MMTKLPNSFLTGYTQFQEKYAQDPDNLMQTLSKNDQKPKAMVVTCCDSRIDPAIVLQCDPGDLFIARIIAALIPSYKPETPDSTSAALEFGLRFLNIPNLIIMGHTQCAGIQSLIDQNLENQTDFIENWLSMIKLDPSSTHCLDTCIKQTIHTSYQNCLSFPWVREKIEHNTLTIHRWFFEIKSGQIYTYLPKYEEFAPITKDSLALSA